MTPSTNARWRGLQTFLAQILRYAIAGSASAMLYVGVTLAASGPLGVPIQLAILVAYVIAVIVNFLLQRHFVFGHTDDFVLPARRQALYYVFVGIIVVGGSAAATTWLPDLLGVSEHAVYIGTVVVTPLLTYTVFRFRVFRAAPW